MLVQEDSWEQRKKNMKKRGEEIKGKSIEQLLK